MLPEFSYEELSIATDEFSEKPSVARNGRHCGKVGTGGYGSVYKGVLRQRIPVAVKRLKRPDSADVYFDSLAQLDSSVFAEEVAKMSRIRHPHILSLLGYNKLHQLIVYEWMANGSLADCLAIKGKHGGLTCSKRVRIAHDIAKALLYIHTFPGCPMLHLNIKSCNILLGESFIAKLGDFGIALRLRGQGETKSRSRTQLNTKSQYMTLTGTYLPPEYIRGKVSAALDVYAFGVVRFHLNSICMATPSKSFQI
jgi:serine/threonine protein kinase